MSGKTLAQKLGIKPGMALWVSDVGRAGLLGPLPDGVTSSDGLGGAQAAILFADDAAGIRALLESNREALQSPALFWVAYPKGNRTDINRDSLWPILSEYRMRPNSQVSIDDVWSALRFRPLAEDDAPFSGGR
jgi:hypothetical protein